MNVTVIIPNKNYNQYLQEAIDSVKNQTVPCKLIVIDYGSEIVPQGAISVVDKGVAHARNCGIGIADTEYILTLDADDELEPTFIEEVLKYADENVIVATGSNEFGEEANVFFPVTGDFTEYNCILNCSLFPKKLWQEIKGFDESMSGYEDWDFWYRAYQAGYRVQRILKPLVKQRIHKDSRNVDAIKNHTKLHEYIIRSRVF